MDKTARLNLIRLAYTKTARTLGVSLGVMGFLPVTKSEVRESVSLNVSPVHLNGASTLDEETSPFASPEMVAAFTNARGTTEDGGILTEKERRILAREGIKSSVFAVIAPAIAEDEVI